MDDIVNKPGERAKIVDKADKAGVIHRTPLKPGMSLKDLPGYVAAVSDEEAEFKRRVAAVKIVKDLPNPAKLTCVVGVLKTGGYEVLYLGDSREEGRRVVLNPERFDHTVRLLPAHRVFGNLAEIVHHTPLRPDENLKQYHARTAPKAPAPLPEEVHAESFGPSAELRARIEERGRHLSDLATADIKTAAEKAGVNMEYVNALPSDEVREETIPLILEKEFGAEVDAEMKARRAADELQPPTNGVAGTPPPKASGEAVASTPLTPDAKPTDTKVPAQPEGKRKGLGQS